MRYREREREREKLIEQAKKQEKEREEQRAREHLFESAQSWLQSSSTTPRVPKQFITHEDLAAYRAAALRQKPSYERFSYSSPSTTAQTR